MGSLSQLPTQCEVQIKTNDELSFFQEEALVVTIVIAAVSSDFLRKKEERCWY